MSSSVSSRPISRRDAVIYVVLVMTLLAAHMVFVSETARADSHDVTGSAFVKATSSSTTERNFVSNVQEVWVNATGGTFTLSFEGNSAPGLNWNATAEDIQSALNAFPGVTVTVTGTGSEATPWVVTFNSPASPRVSLIANYSSLVGTATVDANPGKVLPIDPAGIVSLGDNLLIADHRIAGESIYDGVNLWLMSRDTTTVVATGTTAGYSPAPNGLAYNGNLFMSDPSAGKIFEIAVGPDGVFGTADDEGPWELDLTSLGVTPSDVAWDAADSQLLVAGSDGTVTPVSLGADGRLGGGDDVVGTAVDFSGIVGKLIGLAYRADTDTLLLTDDKDPETIFEVTKDGRLIRTIEIAFIPRPHDLVIAPASGGVGESIYVVDPFHDPNHQDANETPNQDGRLWEIPSPLTNLRPFVDAGPNESISLGDALTLTGDSYDDDQSETATLTTTWSKVSGPGTVSFGNASALSTTASFSAAGTYTLKLTADDGSLSNTDIVSVQVIDPNANQAPTVSAGPDQTITLPDSASLSGSANDDGLPDPPGSLTTTWSKVSGPGTVSFGNASALSTTASFSAAGTYTLRLTANDGSLQSSDDVKITVNPAPDADKNTFIDDDDSIFEADIEWMAAEGITKGCNPPVNDRFCPDDFVTRGQMAAFLVRALGYTDGLGADLFVDDDGSTFENDIDRLGTAGVTKGCNPPTNDRYCPNDFVTRGQMAAFLHRALG